MKSLRLVVLGSLLAVGSSSHAADADEDWKMFGGILSLVQSFVHVAARSDDPRALQEGVDAMLSGRNGEANLMAGKLLHEMLDDMPEQYHGTVTALARDMLAIARRERARAIAAPEASAADRVIQARKDLTAIGLRYYDPAQMLDAVRRDDALAVELFVRARGTNFDAKDGDGYTALEIAKRNGNGQIIAFLSAASTN